MEIQPDLWAARQQMALSLGWHIVIACFGVGFPALMVLAEWLGIRRGDADALRLARRWSKVLAVLFAVGAVSGTILSFELGILWPQMMRTFGDVWGLPFAIEAIAFFVEAIFVGLYLYGWDRMPPKVHLLTGIPIVIAGVASAWFVVTANAWMNQPQGFDVEGYLATGVVTDVDPWAAMFNPATPPQTTHMVLAAFMVAGFGTAAVYAAAMLRGRRDRYHRLGFLLAFSMAAAITPVQIVVGDWAARFLADNQPVKLAALEGIMETQRGAPLTIGGLFIDGEVRYGIEIPKALSLLAKHDPDAEVLGLEEVPPADRPPVPIVRTAFQLMVAIGTGLLALSIWFAIVWWRRRRLPRSRLFLWAAVAAGPLTAVALEAGWVATEVGRQPWIVYGVMRVEDAVTTAPGIRLGYFALIGVYAAMTVGTIFVLRRLASAPDEEPDPPGTAHEAAAAA
ncbi:MAG: cytochrome ubiquinol oxidase subunit I [Actinobacteria bacterium]|nr:cytochrome ubiquinol oxidase subunit I [Actinomycetota bacterium]